MARSFSDYYVMRTQKMVWATALHIFVLASHGILGKHVYINRQLCRAVEMESYFVCTSTGKCCDIGRQATFFIISGSNSTRK